MKKPLENFQGMWFVKSWFLFYNFSKIVVKNRYHKIYYLNPYVYNSVNYVHTVLQQISRSF